MDTPGTLTVPVAASSTIVILDFGSQYTQLIARRIREFSVFSVVLPCTEPLEKVLALKPAGIVLSGGPSSVYDADAPKADPKVLECGIPILGICYGLQFITHHLGGRVVPGAAREYGHAEVTVTDPELIFHGLPTGLTVWMSHGDHAETLAPGFRVTASTSNAIAAIADESRKIWAVQFHPEVAHTKHGMALLKNFVVDICGAKQDWTPESFISRTVEEIREKVGPTGHAICGLSGGVDSSVAAVLVARAIGDRLTCIFVNNGVLRKDEFESVLDSYKHMGLNVKGVDAKQRFYDALTGLTDPEKKRKAIGRVFIEVFDDEAHQVQDVKWLGQGTIYPDVIESVSVKGPSATIKSHHNVGGLPDFMKLKVVEPLNTLFKDEVRKVGKALGIDQNILGRHPFPGPGLAIRILGEVTPQKVHILQEADAIYINNLRSAGVYDKVWQAGTIFLPVQSVGVMGDERTYENVVCLRAVESLDGMTADWCHLPYDLLAKISNEIINNVKGINRVVYDISSKPPATIEWE